MMSQLFWHDVGLKGSFTRLLAVGGGGKNVAGRTLVLDGLLGYINSLVRTITETRTVSLLLCHGLTCSSKSFVFNKAQ